jgi:LCP family protein required for cell wall assembly
MRTTTKRGLGRGASTNGNGRVVLPPAVVAPATSFTRYRQPPPPRRSVASIVAHVLLWLLAGVAVVGSGLAGGAYLYFHETVSDITDVTPEVRVAAKQLNVVVPDRPVVALAIGHDRRTGPEREARGRSDTIMLVRADPQSKALSTLSFPRDLLVDVHCGGGAAPFTARINAAYSDCPNGPRGVLETVRALTSLPVHYLLTVDFRGFKQLVARLGGVWMDVDRRYYNPGGTGYAAINLHPGYQKLNGQNALDYVRFRHTDSDLYRIARQQLFVQAFKQAVTSNFKPTSRTLLKIAGVVRNNVKVGAAGSGAISAQTLISYAALAYDLPAGHTFQTKMDFGCYQDIIGSDGLYGGITASDDCIRDAVREFANPDVDAARKATDVAVGRKPKRRAAPPPSRTSVVVLNGNGVAGAAADTAFDLGKRGYVVLTSGDAPRQDYFHSVIYYNTKPKTTRAAAAALAKLFGDAETQPITRSLRRSANGAMLVVVLGQTYHGRIAPAPVDRTPRKQPANVQTNPGATVELLRPLQRQMPFRLMVPHVLERTSLPARDMPARAYRIAGHPSVRLVFATGASEYWGIQMVAWNDAPALGGANEVLRIKGRRYDLYYSGAKLRMVVVRGPKASYWVVNTIVNSLSNETMLAIAKGLKPLRSG